MAKILIVDNDPIVRRCHTELLALLIPEHEFPTASDGQEASELIAAGDIGYVVTDLDMPRKNGLQLTTWVRQRFPWVVVIMLQVI